MQQLEDGGVSWDAPDWDQRLNIYPFYQAPGYTLDALADHMLEFRRSEPQVLFEVLSRGEVVIISGLRSISIAYRSKIAGGYCVRDYADAMVIDGYQGYEILVSACQDRLHRYGEDLYAMLGSFRITK